jgi:hypothetical protein
MKPATLMQAADLLDTLTRAGYEVTNRCGRIYIRPVPTASALIDALGELHDAVKLALRARVAARNAIMRAHRAAKRVAPWENPPALNRGLPGTRCNIDGTWTGAKTHMISENGRHR